MDSKKKQLRDPGRTAHHGATRNRISRQTPSITMSLDRDLKRLRLEKYTPAAANEARAWIEGILGQRLSGDLLESLKDGVALCK